MPRIDWKQAIADRSITQRELAQRASLSEDTISRIVTGKKPGHPATVRRMVETLQEWPVLLDTRVEQVERG
jgi:predicted transcriptional regulator